MAPTPLHGEKLTTWSVLPSGTHLSLDFVAAHAGFLGAAPLDTEPHLLRRLN